MTPEQLALAEQLAKQHFKWFIRKYKPIKEVEPKHIKDFI